MNHFVYFLRKTLLQGVFKFLACVILLLFFSASLFAGNYTWNGTINSDYSNTGNWSPSGTPGSNDTITINSGKPNLKLDQDRTVNRIVQNGSTIDIDTNQLYVTQRATFNGGDVIGESLKLRGTYVYFQGTDFNCTLDVVVGQIKFSGGTFDQKGTFEQNGGASGWGEGGCVFNDSVTIKCSGATYLRMGQNTGDIFNAPATFISTGVYSIQIAYGDTSFFNDNVFINCTGNGGLSFCAGTNAVAFIAPGKKINAGSSGLTAGVIQIKGIVQSDTTSQSIISTGTSTLNISSCNFTGNSTFSAPSILVKYSTFNGNSTFTKTGNATNQWEGGNVFYGTTTINNNTTGSGILRMALQAGDVYSGDVIFNTSTGYIQVAFADTSTFGGDVTTNNSKVGFSSGSGLLQFNGGEDQALTTAAIISAQKFILTKPGGLLTTNRQITIDSVLTLTGGILSTDSLITLKAPAIVNGGSNVSHVDGPLKKIGNTAFVFPVGDEGQWNPIEISAPAQITDAYTARNYLNAQPYGDVKDSTIFRLNTCSYWTLSRSAGSSKVYVKLYWDSLRCTLYDTSGLGVASWNGTRWDDLGSGTMTGNVLAGTIYSDTTANSYLAFTWTYRTTSVNFITITSSPVLNIGAGTGSWNHPISEDYFGYNGANILDPGQYWSDLESDPNNFNFPVLKNNGISTIRLNGGTFGNYWDWRTGWFIPEDKLPNDWFYTRASHKKPFPPPATGAPFVNDMSLFKTSNDVVGGRPIIQINSLTSSFNYEVASLYRAGELNLPVRYIELGNEFYLGDEQYKEGFPSSLDYINYATDFTNELKLIAPFEEVQVAVVGASTPNGIPGRRALWLDVILENINKYPTSRPDAITIHEYYASGLNQPISITPTNSNIGKMLKKPFSRRDDFLADELHDINQVNTTLNLNPPLEVWLTEYNLDESEGQNVGTWAHGLFNAIQTLSYLESPIITHVYSHAMTSNAVFGNIFENEEGFTAMSSGQLPTNVNTIGPSNFITDKYGFTASGAALNEIALALKGQNVIAHRIDFSNLGISNIEYIENQNTVPTSYLDLYGWSFEKEGGTEAIILNLGPNQYNFTTFDQVGRYQGTNISFESMVQLTSDDQTAGNGGVLPIGSTPPFAIDAPLFTTGEVNISNPLILPGYSLTRLIYKDPTVLSIRLTDDEICEGSETTVIISGMPFGSTCTLNCNSSSQNYSFQSTDSVFILGGLVNEDYTISASAGTATSQNTSLLTVHEPIAVTITTNPGTFDPCSTSTVTLSANVSMITGSLGNSYNYLWVPDKHIIGTNTTPFNSSISVDLADLTTESYQVFVFNEECWASSAPLVIERSPLSVDLGKDFTTCTSPGFTLSTQVVESPHTNGQIFLYKLTGDNAPTTIQSTPDFNISGLSVGTHTYNVEVWVDGVGSTCPAATDEIIVTVVNCCNCNSNVVELFPSSHGPYISYLHPQETYIDETEFITLASNSSYFSTAIANGNGIKKTVTITGNNTSYSTFCINGELWLRSELFDVNQRLETLVLEQCTLKLGPDARIKIRGKVTLVFKGCIIEKCDGSTELWDGVYADIEDEATTEPEIWIDSYTNPTTQVVYNTQIRNAKNAILIRRDAPYRIQHCDFTDNYVDIKMEKCKKITKQGKTGTGATAMFSDNYIRSSTFSSSGNTLPAPHNTVHKFAAIVLDDVERVVIGDSSLNTSVVANVFNNSRYGIIAINSSVEIYNNNFSALTSYSENWPSQFPNPEKEPKMNAVGIYNFSNFDFTDRNLIVGESFDFSGTDTRNSFENIKYNIWSQNESNIQIQMNDFGVGDEDYASGCDGIVIHSPGNKTIDISNDNIFESYRYGIRISELTPKSKLTIENNLFYYGWTNQLSYTGTAINIYNASPVIPEIAEIKGNIMGGTLNSSFLFPRIGIRVAKIYRIKIQDDNQISFNFSSTPPGLYSGIWLQDCNGAKVIGNKILNTNPPSQLYQLNDQLVGLRIDESHGTCIEWNSLEGLGQGMRFYGNSLVYSLFKNTTNGFDQGFYLNSAYIGSSQGWGGINIKNDLDNSWVRSSGTTKDRIQGQTLNGSPIDWYTRSTGASDPRYPDGDPFVVIPNTIVSTASSVSQCPVEISDDPPYTNIARNAWFGSVTGDSARYDENYYNQFKYLSESVLFNELKRYPALLAMDDSADGSFQDFYEDRLNSNYALFDSLIVLINNDLHADALQLLEDINDTNDIEFCLKSVFQIYLNSRINGVDFTSQDTTLLDSIAELNAITTGPGVLMARILLNKEVYDYLSSGSRLFSPNRIEEANVFDIHIYPNPTRSLLFVRPNLISENYSISIADITGRTLLQSFNHFQIETTSLNTGSYLLIYAAEDYRVVKKFEIIK